MARICIFATLPDADLAAFNGDIEASIRARLGEVYDDDANPVVLHTLGVDVEEE